MQASEMSRLNNMFQRDTYLLQTKPTELKLFRDTWDSHLEGSARTESTGHHGIPDRNAYSHVSHSLAFEQWRYQSSECGRAVKPI